MARSSDGAVVGSIKTKRLLHPTVDSPMPIPVHPCPIHPMLHICVLFSIGWVSTIKKL